MPTLSPGPISSSTMRARHLIPPFMEALESVDPDSASKVREEYQGVFECLNSGNDPEIMDDCNDLVNERLFGLLNDYCPPFHYFGSHEGDGACFGVWFSRESYSDSVADGTVHELHEGEDFPYVMEADQKPLYFARKLRKSIDIHSSITKELLVSIEL